MNEQIVKSESGAIVQIDGDNLTAIAAQAEKRIDAVMKIKKVALKVTNAMDWVDQQGKPYLMASGAEKVANLFNISWKLLTPEPLIEVESDGNYTFTYQGEFSLGNRTIQCEGSRSSRDRFFTQYEKGSDKKEKLVEDRDNKRDVKMAAYTNLLGNGITRILGIRNLTYADLLEFAGIEQGKLQKVEYKTNPKANVKPPETTTANPSPSRTEPETAATTVTTEQEPPQREPGQDDGEPSQTIFEKLQAKLSEMCGGDESKMKDLLKEVTIFKAADGSDRYKLSVDKFKRDTGGEKWAIGAYRKLIERAAE